MSTFDSFHLVRTSVPNVSLDSVKLDKSKVQFHIDFPLIDLRIILVCELIEVVVRGELNS
jgi:hypothetical protein